jgi:hypothetical protein
MIIKIRFICIFILTITMFAGSSIHSQAIFGLSKCERVKKSVLAEEAIGVIFWKELNATRQVIRKKSSSLNPNNLGNLQGRDGASAYKALNQILRSNLKVYRIIEKNPKCFSNDVITQSRTYKSQIQRVLPSINAKIRKFDQAGSSTFSDFFGDGDYKYLMSVYLGFYSILKD